MQIKKIPTVEGNDAGTVSDAGGRAQRDDHAPGKGAVQPVSETGN